MKRIIIGLLCLITAVFWLCACDDHYDLEDQYKDAHSKIHVENTFFKDADGRYLYVNGVNVSGSGKWPATSDPISYVGKPFPLDEADWNFQMLRKLGFNSIRLVMTWEAVEPYEKGQYDDEYLDYIEKLIAKANDYNIYVLLDFHQDLFSRHLFKLFDDGTNVNGLTDDSEREKGMKYGLNNRVGGDGAPRWAVQVSLPDKNVYSPEWGLPVDIVTSPTNTSDFLPWTSWFLNGFFSVDNNRCWAALFAGDKVWPNYFVDGQNVKDYLQEAYADAFREVAKRVKGYPNVLGYDIINEPGGVFIMLTLYSMLYREAQSTTSGDLNETLAVKVMDRLLGDLVDGGMSIEDSEAMRSLILEYKLLPTSLKQIYDSGFLSADATSPYKPELDEVLKLNTNFNRNYLQDFHSRVGKAILEEDPDAIIWVEQVLGLPDRGIANRYAEPMLRPDGLNNIVFEGHWYTDIYPAFGFNESPRDFTIDEIRFRSYTDDIADAVSSGTFSLGNPPVVLGEFGTYYNFGGIEKSMENDYIISSVMLEPYFQAFEELLLHRMLWCYSSENTAENGELWNKEDFSLLGPDRQPRSWEAYSRTTPILTSGRLKSMSFNSPLHYFEPRDGEQTPYLEFNMEMLSKETEAPTEIFVPPLHYTDGFYVYISDGKCAYDPDSFVLYWFPSEDDPDTVHNIKIRPPYPNYGDNDWNYFFNKDQILEGVK